ncbi:MAG: universal stress protein [Microbacteriaceae bacterium]
MVGFDSTIGSHAGLLAAIDLARATGRELEVVYVEHTDPIVTASTALGPGAGAVIAAEQARAEVCRSNCADICNAAGVAWTFDVRHGNPADQLIEAANQVNATYIVVGRHGHHGLTRLLAGSVSQRLLHHAKHPLLVVPPPSWPPEN